MHKLVMYGGAFNPPHRDHTGIVEKLLENTAEKILIIPTGKRDDKSYGTTDQDRENMIRLATEDYSPSVEIDTTFLYGNMSTTTIAQAQYLREKYGRDIPQVFGSDTAPHMMEWDPTGYAAYVLPKVFITRPYHPLDHSHVSNYDIVEYESGGFSSTEVRREILRILLGESQGEVLRKSVQEKVLNYILSYGLFIS